MLLLENSAAQYLRMSTDMQRYSIENQSEAISLYAASRGLTIVCTYEDAGRSGLSMGGRAGLQALLRDVRSGAANFKTILVYDVSRWGRFQDSDESAFYEYSCKAAGVRVEYCAEQFENDGSLTTAILKSVKRAMAGEFSRELSAKVFAGQCKIVSKGFFIGSSAGFGLRRCLVDEGGTKRVELTAGQRKSISTERVILVPGPVVEISTIHSIYNLYIENKKSLDSIAKSLNERGIKNGLGRVWKPAAVKDVLTNEKYIGTAVFNRTSKKLNNPQRRNPSNLWIRATGAFDPVVTPDRFAMARRQLTDNINRYTDNELLDNLTAVWCQQHRLSATIIEATLGCSINTYRTHFGTLVEAYRKIGYTGRFNAGKHLKQRKALTRAITDHLLGLNINVRAGPACGQFIANELSVAVVFGSKPALLREWVVDYQSPWKPDILVVAHLDKEKSPSVEYFVLPYAFLPRGRWFHVRGIRYRRYEAFRSRTLEPLYRLCMRQPLFEAA